ncbi:MAG TPA: DUF892 family protein, partial [Cyclobacteriaceae bacterium]|nr:DUF892 family protein [Cyclobacteriaceae bacterium]
PSSAREVLVIAAFDSFVQSRLSSYMMAARMAAQMELDPVVELLDQIMEWEKQSLHQLNKIATKKIGLLQKDSLTLAA